MKNALSQAGSKAGRSNMPAKLTLCSADPRAAFRAVIEETLDGATGLDVAVAFMTEAGADLFSKWAKIVQPQNCRLCVSVQFPTDLDALMKLHKVLGSQLHIHLKSGPQEMVGSPTLSSLLHSKIMWIKGGDRHVSIFVGSHNWTSSALDSVNFEASTRIECDIGDQFEQEVKSHINACVHDCVVFNPNDIDYYRSLQIALFPKRPKGPERQPIRQCKKADGTVIHAEDHWKGDKPNSLLLYLPLDEPLYNKWFKSEPPTTVYMYLYPSGSLTASGPPTATPELYYGEIRTHSRDAIPGMPVNCQIPNLSLPQLTPVPSGNIPERKPGVIAQAVGTLRQVQATELPVYVQGHRPSAQVEPRFEKTIEQAPSPEVAIPAPNTIQHYFTPDSIRNGKFVFLNPMPHYSLSIKVPGQHLYPIPPDQIIRPILERTDRAIGLENMREIDGESKLHLREPAFCHIEILVDDAKEEMRYVYPVSFVFAHE
jgi:HKD family nuclease